MLNRRFLRIKVMQALYGFFQSKGKEMVLAERELITQSATIEIDEDGRIVLPPKVREKMGFAPDDLSGGAEAAFAGATNRFKLYRRDVYDAELAADDEDDDGNRRECMRRYG